MRTWGVGIFDNELAQEIRDDFEAGLAVGLSVFMVSEQIMQKYAEQNSIVMYLALAALQLEYDVIQPKIKKRALTAIISGDAAEPWEEAGKVVYENRKQALHELRMKLLAMPT